MSDKYGDPGYPAAPQIAESLRSAGMVSMEIDNSATTAVAVVSTGYVTLTVAGFELAESPGDPLDEVLEVIAALRLAGIQALRYWGPDSDTTYVNTIVTEGPTGVNSIAVTLGWPSSS